MEKIEKLGSAKRFGARYGTKPKYLFAEIEQEQRRKHKCPYCNAVKVRRVAVGIWHCRKCDAKFTGKAYSIEKPAFTEEAQAKGPELAEEAEESNEEISEEDEKNG